MFLRFWLSKITRIIHHNQLLLTKFGRILPYWTDDVKSAAKLHIIQPLTEKIWGRIWVAFEESNGEVSNGRTFYSFHGELLSKNIDGNKTTRQTTSAIWSVHSFSRFRYRDFVTRFVLWASLPIILARAKSTWTSTWQNRLQSSLYITALYIAVTLDTTVTGQLPKIFSCLIFSAKLTCIQWSPRL